MSGHSCGTSTLTCDAAGNADYRRILWLVLLLNAIMFVIELAVGWAANSVSLQADAIDFGSDAFSYGISLYVLNRSVRWRAGAALLKATLMAALGVWILWRLYQHYQFTIVPDAPMMGGVGLVALVVNVLCAWLLFKFRGGDSNQESVWQCSRNDAINNIAVMFAAGAVGITRNNVPDLIVALFMVSLALWSAATIVRHATTELREKK